MTERIRIKYRLAKPNRNNRKTTKKGPKLHTVKAHTRKGGNVKKSNVQAHYTDTKNDLKRRTGKLTIVRDHNRKAHTRKGGKVKSYKRGMENGR